MYYIDLQILNYLNFQKLNNYRKTKSTGEKSRTPAYLNCEAWHTGADILDRYAEKGTKITFMATAKNMSKDDHRVVFRINEFDLCHPEFEDQNEKKKDTILY